jgi:DNA-binding CsgD family transcriptional regulator
MLGFLGEPAGAQAPLTARELEVAGLVADGLTSHSIALRLSIAPRTAEAHVENIRRKLQVHSRAQIARWVTERRLRAQRLGSSPDARRGPDRLSRGQPGRQSVFHSIAARSWPALASRYA